MNLDLQALHSLSSKDLRQMWISFTPCKNISSYVRIAAPFCEVPLEKLFASVNSVLIMVCMSAPPKSRKCRGWGCNVQKTYLPSQPWLSPNANCVLRQRPIDKSMHNKPTFRGAMNKDPKDGMQNAELHVRAADCLSGIWNAARTKQSFAFTRFSKSLA